MSERLYLIRIDMERFLGPLSQKEMREAYRRMEFGLQDEIAASNKLWVSFDDLELVKRHYPELVGFVKKEMLSGWVYAPMKRLLSIGYKCCLIIMREIFM